MVPGWYRQHGVQGSGGEGKIAVGARSRALRIVCARFHDSERRLPALLDPFRRIKQPVRVGILRRDDRDFNFHGYVAIHIQDS